jgi:hypothetical protein
MEMRTQLFNRVLAGLILLTVMFSGCKKEDEVPEFQELGLDTQAVLDKLPAGLLNSSDENAQECVTAIEDALDMSSFIDDMVPPDDAVKSGKKGSGDTWTWTVSDGMMTVSYYWTYDEDNTKHYWTMEIQINGGERHTYVDAWEMKDGTAGEVVFNFGWTSAYKATSPEEGEDLFWTWTWTLDNDGTYNFTMLWDSSDPEYDYYLRYEVVVNDDGSGTIDYYLMEELLIHYEWDELGNGSWILYLGEGNTMTGTWTV